MYIRQDKSHDLNRHDLETDITHYMMQTL